MKVDVLGSNDRFFFPVNATQTDQIVQIPFEAKEISFINRGPDIWNVAFDGKQSTGQNYPSADATWTYVGAWSNSTVGGVNSKYTNTTNIANTATFKPNIAGLISLTADFLRGSSIAIAKIELSGDNGSTWQNPSDIAGVIRSDGVTGAAMNTYDGYYASAVVGSIAFTLPYGLSKVWAMRITPTNTQNALATGSPNVMIVGAKVNNGTILTIEVNETISLPIQTKQFNISTPSTSSGRVIAL